MSKNPEESEVITLSSGETFVNVKTLIDFLKEKQEKLDCEKPPQNQNYDSGYYDGLQFTINKMVGILDEYEADEYKEK